MAETAVQLEAAPALQAPPAVPSRRFPTSRLIGLGLLLLLALVPILFGDFGFFVGQYALVYAVLGMSITVVTGYAGLISLMPYTFAGIGAMITGLAVSSWGWPFWLAVPIAALATVPVSVAVGVASVRLKGLYLAIATLTFATALGETFFKWGAVTGGNRGWEVERPRLGPIDFSSDAAFYVLCLVVVLAVLWMVEGLRTSRVGRAMLAVRDNELEAQALGINVYKTKIVALIVGGMIAGVGGGLLAALLGVPPPSAYQSPYVEIPTLLLLSLVAIGGIDRPLGAFFGAIVLVVQSQVFQGAEFFFRFVGIYSALLLILFLMFRPGGLLQVGRLQLELIRRRPVLGIVSAVVILGVNIGLAWLFVALS